MVGADLPQRVVAAHPVVPDHEVHQRLLERMPHVQRAGDVGRRQLDAETARRPPASKGLNNPFDSQNGYHFASMAWGSKLLASSMGGGAS